MAGSGERLLLEGHVGVKVDLGRLDADVTQPEGDDAGVDARVEQRIAVVCRMTCAVTVLSLSEGQSWAARAVRG